MSKRYYRVKKDTFLWLKGAIIESENSGGYTAISDLWNATDKLDGEYITCKIIEAADNSEWFERVHEVSVLGKAKYLTTAMAREAHDELYKEGK